MTDDVSKKGNKQGGDGSKEAAAPKKEISKKEQKKLAKKAEKDAAKNKSGGGGGGGEKGVSTGKSEKTEKPVANMPTFYHLQNGGDNPSTLKASVMASHCGISLVPDRSSISSSSSRFLHSPALTVHGHTIFGGNAILKALSEKIASPIVDEWLEYERITLRKAAVDSKQGMKVLEQALVAGGGLFLVGEGLSIADISVVCTLYHCTSKSSSAMNFPKVVQTYLDYHIENTPAFAAGLLNLPILFPSQPLDLTAPSLSRAVCRIFQDAVYTAFPLAAAIPTLERKHFASLCTKKAFGDYQCTAAMSLFQKLKLWGALPPDVVSSQSLAQKIIDAIPIDNPVIDELAVAKGPGFIVCRVKSAFLQNHMNIISHLQAVVPPRDVKSEIIVVDFSSPNIAKEMHVGHLRSTIIGEVSCRILEYVGHTVNRVNHVGDWGTQFGMLIQYLGEEFSGDEYPNITDLTVFYKNAKARFDEDADFKKSSQLNVVKLQGGDEHCLKTWKLLCDISRKEFEKVYKRLDVTIQECGESFYNSKIPAVIQEFDDAGLVRVEEGGAKCVFIPKFQSPLMLQKSDGGFGYDSTDMAALKHRLFTLGATRIIVITDYSQADHFAMCNTAAAKIGWLETQKKSKGIIPRLEHIGFGTVQGEDGQRFKTRSGDTVRLVDLLDEAVSRMERNLHDRIADKKASITTEQVPSVAAALGYGAVKYFDLNRNPTSNYKFSYDDMLNENGNTAIYLLYAHARLESICGKAIDKHNCNVDDLIAAKKEIVIGDAYERNLAFQLQLFADMVEETLEDLYPCHVCSFLYKTSGMVSVFLDKCKVLGTPEMESRLLLCRATAIVMRQCFDLLAIRYPMRI
eukprot:CAMPEP_0194355636 /NCGR_PEP_ID=MMETSP0174-20130528/3513_1 /TAXON_ID=216777 /ORGANISM="Proboscia alata, Strain PI-D3" /LENGTH=853 /DNA_ID=CAMNT_0039124983 /DNA_START=17 /DNA_END=2578 /DNA_ORIENTATION=+